MSTRSRDKTVTEADRFPYPFFTYAEGTHIEGARWLRFRFGPRTGHTLEFVKDFWKS